MPSRSKYDPPTFSTAKVANYVRRDQTWTNTPNYSNVPRSNLPINDYHDTQEELHQERYEGGWWIRSDGVVHYDLVPQYLFTGQDIQGLGNELFYAVDWIEMAEAVANQNVLKLLSKIADQKANFAVMAAEAHKTVDLILSSATRVVTAYEQFVRGNFKGLAKTLGINSKTRHKTWLEYKYGWMPVLMDIKGVAEAYAEHIAGPARPPRFSVSVVTRVPVKGSWSYTYAAYGGGAPGTYTKKLEGTYEVKHKLTLEVVNPEFVRLQQMGLTNPLEVAWELVPFSFVFDWMFSVGDWLRGLSALHGLRQVSGMRSNTNAFVASYDQPRTVRSDGVTTWLNSARSYRDLFRDHARISWTLTDIPDLPSFQDPIKNLDRLVTGLSLLKGQIRGQSGPSTRTRLRV